MHNFETLERVQIDNTENIHDCLFCFFLNHEEAPAINIPSNYIEQM